MYSVTAYYTVAAKQLFARVHTIKFQCIFRPERKCEDQLHDLKINVYVGMLISDAYHA